MFFNQTYYGCIKLIGIENGVEEYTEKAWCSTKVDVNTKEHIRGGSHYGDCPSDCPSAEEAAANLQSDNQIKNSGLWKPNSNKSECGQRVGSSNQSKELRKFTIYKMHSNFNLEI